MINLSSIISSIIYTRIQNIIILYVTVIKHYNFLYERRDMVFFVLKKKKKKESTALLRIQLFFFNRRSKFGEGVRIGTHVYKYTHTIHITQTQGKIGTCESWAELPSFSLSYHSIHTYTDTHTHLLTASKFPRTLLNNKSNKRNE